jgi:hypothetical protein
VVCFEVFLNQQRLCLAGVGEHGLLSAFLSWHSLAPAERAPYQQGQGPHLGLIVNGGGGSRMGESLHWIDDMPVNVGDEVKIRVIEAEAPDEPKRRTVREQKEAARDTRRRLYEELKREFESDGAAA